MTYSMSIKFKWFKTCGLVLAGLLAASCSREPAGYGQPDASATPLAFEAYVPRVITRAGVPGDVTTAGLATGNLGAAGFGVFGYYTGSGQMGSGSQPNYMYNQQVKKSGGKWVYSPVKYWPNEYPDALATETDHVSFFAYAPYVDVTRATGLLDTSSALAEGGNTATGIVSLSALADQGDPLVNYVVSTDPTKGVDLCWATVADHPDTANPTATFVYWGYPSARVRLTGGLPWLNLTRAPSVDDRIQLVFRHATAKLNVQIDAPSDYVVGDTRVYVREVAFTGMAMEGALNLNNRTAATAQWVGFEGNGRISRETVKICDGRQDGLEGRFADSGEGLTGINPTLIQDTAWGDAAQQDGVTATTVNLFGSGADALSPLYVIPNGQPLTVTLTYDIETADTLPGTVSDGFTQGVSVENRTSLAIRNGSADVVMEAGKSYTLLLHVGLNGLRFDVAVEDDWDYNVEDLTI